MLWSTHSEIQILVLHNLVARILQNSAFQSNLMHLLNSSGNRDKYLMDRMLRNMIKLAARFVCPTDLRYFPMYYYQTSRYREALSVVAMTKIKIKIRHGRCLCPAHQMLYMEAFGGQSWTFKMKHTARNYIVLNNYIMHLDELILECCNSVCGFHSKSFDITRFLKVFPKKTPRE